MHMSFAYAFGCHSLEGTLPKPEVLHGKLSQRFGFHGHDDLQVEELHREEEKKKKGLAIGVYEDMEDQSRLSGVAFFLQQQRLAIELCIAAHFNADIDYAHGRQFELEFSQPTSVASILRSAIHQTRRDMAVITCLSERKPGVFTLQLVPRKSRVPNEKFDVKMTGLGRCTSSALPKRRIAPIVEEFHTKHAEIFF